MPWTQNDYPDSMKNLSEKTRNKAIEIANALLRDGYSEGRAIPIAISQAETWANTKGHSSQSGDSSGQSQSGENKHFGSGGSGKGANQHVVPHEGGWAIRAEDGEKSSFVFDTKEEAVHKGKEVAAHHNAVLVIHRQDGTIERNEDYAKG